MPKYRNLNTEELQALEQEFIDYLVVNGITADDWIRIKKEDQQDAQRIIALFSDVVFEKMMRKTEFLIRETEDSLFCFHYQSKEAIMVGLKSKESKLNLEEDISEKISSGTYELVRGNKTYKQQREVELFKMIQNGAEVSDGKWYKQLVVMIS